MIRRIRLVTSGCGIAPGSRGRGFPRGRVTGLTVSLGWLTMLRGGILLRRLSVTLLRRIPRVATGLTHVRRRLSVCRLRGVWCLLAVLLTIRSLAGRWILGLAVRCRLAVRRRRLATLGRILRLAIWCRGLYSRGWVLLWTALQIGMRRYWGSCAGLLVLFVITLVDTSEEKFGVPELPGQFHGRVRPLEFCRLHLKV